MRTKLSGLVDGELSRHDETALIDSLRSDAELCRRWQEYLLIRDALKGRGALDCDITASVMAKLDDEPTVLAPRRTELRGARQRPILTLAATLAGVAVVGWMAFGSSQSPKYVTMAASHTEPVGTPARQTAHDMQEYLVAHQAQASSLQFRGGTEHIRTVAATGAAASK